MGRLLKKYGTDMTLEREGKRRPLRAVFQSVTSRSWQSIEDTAGPLGESCRRQYLCLAPGQEDIREEDVLILGEDRYRLRRVESYRVGGKVLYLWGMCVKLGKEDLWGSRSLT